MAEILGVGITHYPPLLGEPDHYADLLRMVMNSHLVPGEMKDPASWPEGMREAWDNEHAVALEHQERHKAALAEVRREIDDFKPDAVIVFGDDQYENFKEDVIPPFNMYCMDSFPSSPFSTFLKDKPNIWNVDSSHEYEVPGAGRIGREIVDAVISRHRPIAYSYKYSRFPHLSHAFANAFVFLDWDKRGWNYPVIPISVNCYGSGVIHTKGGMAQLFDQRSESEKDPYLDAPGPAGPTPRSCFELGQTLREVLDARPERFVVTASSGWSHAFLTEKNHWLYPDREFDSQRHDELCQGEQRKWRDIENSAIDDAGSQEFKNWICLAGVVEERKAKVIDYLDTWIFNSQKCFATFK